MKGKILAVGILIFWFLFMESHAQNLISNSRQLQEYLRRSQLTEDWGYLCPSFNYRPFHTDSLLGLDQIILANNQEKNYKKIKVAVLPIFQTLKWNPDRPYGWGDGPMIPAVGLQSYTSTGFYAKFSLLKIQIQPELVLAQNSSFQGFGLNRTRGQILDRFRFYNFDDSPELFGQGGYTNLSWGQSKVSLEVGAFEAGISTQNIWWGPGQFNGLIFSNNAEGFPHLTLNTIRPAKTFMGNFEGQILMGRLENSGFGPTQFEELNELYFRPFTGDWRYLNGLTISYNPKWIPGLFVGMSRTFQQYSEFMGNDFRSYFPIFEVFQKEGLFENGNTVEYDNQGTDQQVALFGRLLIPKAQAEVYFEYGRRDHAFNWREAILNPEHARAYLLGFSKLVQLSDLDKTLQIRGEITHQQESVNRYLRYPGLLGGASWQTHNAARGFTNFGQPLGVGIGTGSNVQTLEVSLVEKFNKMGILLERLENHQDFYYRAFGQQKVYKPWVDLSLGFLFDKQWNNLILSSKLQLINGMNYQWQLHENSTPDFPQGKNLFSIHSQVSLIYLPHNLFKGAR